ncbi:cation-transporting P-type ATPase [Alkalilimnicola ehrlichii MLHE-1]|uniref:ATPase, P-type (Transporting), HAD superfamily, subfamily IC n=1 Tax=Alkalilimnicola ehrlichii (strain ATCC BAA-1101 / DSM 17681 / MLHE-1) TaxID=187272 RepID=Q0AAX7_ALKEH|nr:cation-transporting P-type ATPase [Alkalilimnicola ehrlichii]ABI56010.1 ATPase, P-type (transporting), HAD superfamily, subfamily IC [Alkalilimnicola ehrlichii MLHE-1]
MADDQRQGEAGTGLPEGAGNDQAWHALSCEQVRRHWAVTREGLSPDEARDRLDRYGRNELKPPERASALVRFLRHFHNILIYILIAAAIGTALLGHWVDTGVIAAVVLINTLIGFVQEGKAEKALDAIRQMLSPMAVVVRDGKRREVPAAEIVPGDIIHLQAGDKVPADLRLLEAKNLRIEEAVLTGESVPVEKGLDPVAKDAPLGDRAGMAYSGTLVTFGRGVGVVVATGERTEIGRISAMLGEVESLQTPLVRQVEQFGRWLAAVIIAISAATFAFGYWVRDYPLDEMFLAAASLAVSSIPEGLPAIMTIALAIGVQKMARRNAIIRKLPAVETLGSVSAICSDKTGTLTRNEMTVQVLAFCDRQVEVDGVGYAPHGGFSINDRDVDPEDNPALWETLRAGLLCNDAQLYEKNGDWVMEGDPTEGALLTVARKAGMDPQRQQERYPRIDVIPFESDHKYMATLHHDHHGHEVIYLKGAPERVLSLCRRQMGREGPEPLDESRWKGLMDGVAGRGQRLLAIAARDGKPGQRTLDYEHVEQGDFTLMAVVGIIDPPRDEAIRAVKECIGAGVRVKMITGDHLITARAVGDMLGINRQGGGRALSGHQIDAMDDRELHRAVAVTDVFARTSPEHKLRLVEALQAGGRIVAMTGDGVNDAPALKRADVGVAMGHKGTEAAKEASEMVLADDNFASIAHAVEEGRTVYDNIRKAILHMLPTNAGQSLTIMMAILMGLALPLTPVQVLWVNMVTSVTLAMALAFEPSEPGVMRRPPRAPDTPLLSGFLLWRIPFVAVLLWIGTFGHFVYMEEVVGVSDELARTVAINTLVAGQAFYLFNLRLIYQPVLVGGEIFKSRAMWMAIGVLVVLQLSFTYLPVMNTLFGLEPIGMADWGRILAFGLAVFVIVELEKAVLRRLPWVDTGEGQRQAAPVR